MRDSLLKCCYRGIELFAAIGIEQVLLTNASGGLTSDLVVGEIVVLNDHIDFVRNTLPAEYLKTNGSQVYDEVLSTNQSRVLHRSAGHILSAWCLCLLSWS